MTNDIVYCNDCGAKIASYKSKDKNYFRKLENRGVCPKCKSPFINSDNKNEFRIKTKSDKLNKFLNGGFSNKSVIVLTDEDETECSSAIEYLSVLNLMKPPTYFTENIFYMTDREKMSRSMLNKNFNCFHKRVSSPVPEKPLKNIEYAEIDKIEEILDRMNDKTYSSFFISLSKESSEKISSRKRNILSKINEKAKKNNLRVFIGLSLNQNKTREQLLSYSNRIWDIIINIYAEEFKIKAKVYKHSQDNIKSITLGSSNYFKKDIVMTSAMKEARTKKKEEESFLPNWFIDKFRVESKFGVIPPVLTAFITFFLFSVIIVIVSILLTI